MTKNNSGIFTYQGLPGPDGIPETVHADAYDIHLRLIATLGNGANQLLAATRNQQEPATAATAKLRVIEAVRQVFDLPPVDPGTGCGVTARQCEEALKAFLNFQMVGSNSTGSLPTSSLPESRGTSFDPAALPEMTS